MSWSDLLPLTIAVLSVAMGILWLVSLVRRDASIVDPFWGIGFVLVAWVAWSAAAPTQQTGRNGLLLTLTTVWGVRLSWHLLRRNRAHGEDRRYAAMRAYHGPRFWWVSLGTVFGLQGLILGFVSLPILGSLVAGRDTSLGLLDYAGLALWCVGFFCEAVGDWQLSRFQADPANAGRILDRGLWRYTRHPNYFGDFCVWWGLYLIAAAGGAGWTIGSPALMAFLLLRVSGVTLLEQTIAERRPEYLKYQQTTNAFFPGPPRSIAD